MALSRAPESLHQSALGMLPNTGIHDHGLAEIEPQGRGVVVQRVSGYPGRAYLTIVADAGGVIGASLGRTRVGSDMTATNIINETFLRPLIDLVADLVQEARRSAAPLGTSGSCYPTISIFTRLSACRRACYAWAAR